jgi:hypothetical protein
MTPGKVTQLKGAERGEITEKDFYKLLKQDQDVCKAWHLIGYRKHFLLLNPLLMNFRQWLRT